VMSRCPQCGARVQCGAGEPTPAHMNDETKQPCTGQGQPSR
jgi:hypothetical protein